MIKIFVTGDNHFGMTYSKYPEVVREQLKNSRYECLQNMVDKAVEEGCEYFVVTGDMFETVNVKKSDVVKAIDILGSFSGGTVLIIPGNHDFYTGDGNEQVWRYFKDASAGYSNIVLLNEYEPRNFGDIIVYPAFCDKKHSEENKLDWIKDSDIDTDRINIGIAHGAVEGLSLDSEGRYFYMSKKELNDIPVDAWLIGHTHVPFPGDLKEDDDKEGYKIFNAGTHEQTDVGNNTEGCGFIITIDKADGKAAVKARKFVSGRIRHYDFKDVKVFPDNDNALETALKGCFSNITDPQNSIVRINVTGTIKSDEYSRRGEIYKGFEGRFMSCTINDDDLAEEITIDRINAEFSEDGVVAEFLRSISDNTELQMAYNLVKGMRE